MREVGDLEQGESVTVRASTFGHARRASAQAWEIEQQAEHQLHHDDERADGEERRVAHVADAVADQRAQRRAAGAVRRGRGSSSRPR